MVFYMYIGECRTTERKYNIVYSRALSQAEIVLSLSSTFDLFGVYDIIYWWITFLIVNWETTGNTFTKIYRSLFQLYIERARGVQWRQHLWGQKKSDCVFPSLAFRLHHFPLSLSTHYSMPKSIFIEARTELRLKYRSFRMLERPHDFLNLGFLLLLVSFSMLSHARPSIETFKWNKKEEKTGNISIHWPISVFYMFFAIFH